MNFHEILTGMGFHKFGSCSCGGVRNIIYHKQRLKVYVRPTRKLFMMKNRNAKEIELTDIEKLEEKLNEYFKDISQEARKEKV